MLVYLQIIETQEDKSKFETLYWEYRDVMYHAAYQILNNPEDAEDAVHQAFVRIAERITKIDGTICKRTKSLVVTITEHISIDVYRRRYKIPFVEMEEYHGATIPYYGTNQLAACMAKLPPHYRNVLLLKHYHGYSTQETAKLLEMSEANVLKTSKRAREKLKKLLKEEGIL